MKFHFSQLIFSRIAGRWRGSPTEGSCSHWCTNHYELAINHSLQANLNAKLQKTKAPSIFSFHFKCSYFL